MKLVVGAVFVVTVAADASPSRVPIFLPVRAA